MSPPATWLYVATGDDGVRKLGATINPHNRMRYLRAEYWQSFRLNRTWHRPLADGRLIEHIAHAILRPYRAPMKRLCFEFYNAPLDTLYAVVSQAIDKAEVGDLSDLSATSSFVKRARRAMRRAPPRAPYVWRTPEEWQELFRQAEEEMNRAG